MRYETWMDNHYLVRHTDNKDLKDPETDLLKLDYIVIYTDHLRDFSTNLLGIFTAEDCHWKIDKARMGAYFGTAWHEGQTVEAPLPEECEQVADRGAFYIPIKGCAGKKVPALGSEAVITICDVLHTPIRCNFWHFSLRWKDENGVYFDEFRPRSVKNFFKSCVRKFIQDHAAFEEPSCPFIPLDKYQNL